MNTVQTPQLKQWKTAQRPLLLLNVLDEQAYEKDHIPDSRNVPLGRDDFVDEVGRLAGTKDRTIVTYCASTQCDASERAAQRLEQAGYTNVFDYEGGMKAWKEAEEGGASASSSQPKPGASGSR